MKHISVLKNITRSVLLASMMVGVAAVVHAQSGAAGAGGAAGVGGAAGAAGQAGGGMGGKSGAMSGSGQDSSMAGQYSSGQGNAIPSQPRTPGPAQGMPGKKGTSIDSSLGRGSGSTGPTDTGSSSSGVGAAGGSMEAGGH
jgi:hypothetical protein